MDDQLKIECARFSSVPDSGKIQVSPTKPLTTQHDLALAYSLGVAAPCLEIAADPLAADKYSAHPKPSGGDLQRYGGARAGQHWRAGEQTGDER